MLSNISPLAQVTHLGYYQSEEEAAMVYDRVAVSLHGPNATTNFPASRHTGSGELFGLGREDLQRALGVKPMDKSSRFRGVSRKKGKWEAKACPLLKSYCFHTVTHSACLL